MNESEEIIDEKQKSVTAPVVSEWIYHYLCQKLCMSSAF